MLKENKCNSNERIKKYLKAFEFYLKKENHLRLK